MGADCCQKAEQDVIQCKDQRLLVFFIWQRNGGEQMMRLSLKVNVKTTKQRLWELITHPEGYPSFIPNVKEVTVLERNQETSLVRWKISIEEVEMQWTEQCHYDGQNARLSFHMVRGDFSAYDGILLIEHASHGVDLVLDVTIDWGLPSFEKVIARVV